MTPSTFTLHITLKKQGKMLFILSYADDLVVITENEE